jgi:hypothetical protein
MITRVAEAVVFVAVTAVPTLALVLLLLGKDNDADSR